MALGSITATTGCFNGQSLTGYGIKANFALNLLAIELIAAATTGAATRQTPRWIPAAVGQQGYLGISKKTVAALDTVSATKLTAAARTPPDGVALYS